MIEPSAGHARPPASQATRKVRAISEELAWAVLGAVEDAAEDDDTWIIGLTGTGKAFCAGLDLTGDRTSTTPA
ncbi:MAG: hypothetical protein ACFCVK_18455 [Acidimicrobiales bacterium]